MATFHASTATGGDHRGLIGAARSAPCPSEDVLRGAVVVVVDDEPSNVVLLERVLRAAGVEHVHGVSDPRQAVQCCLQVDADLLVLDLNMPVMDGFAVMAALHDDLPADAFLPVLVLTADATTDTRDRALEAGAKDFVTKPFDRTEVTLRVRNLLETQRLYTDVRGHNAALQADLDERVAEDRRREELHRERLRRIDGVLRGDALAMVFQPVVELDTMSVRGMEALARFDVEPRRSPDQWFDEAAMVGRGTELELAAVRAALRHLDRLPPDVFLSLNVSPATALEPVLRQLLHPESGRVVLELTEHDRIDDYDRLIDALAELRRRGLRVAVDDAGAGYAGLRHILRLRPDIIKLDLDLTRNIDTDPARRALSTAMVSFAREVDATIIAEGIESESELQTVHSLGIGLGQGYHLGRPAPLPTTPSRRPFGHRSARESP